MLGNDHRSFYVCGPPWPSFFIDFRNLSSDLTRCDRKKTWTGVPTVLKDPGFGIIRPSQPYKSVLRIFISPLLYELWSAKARGVDARSCYNSNNIKHTENTRHPTRRATRIIPLVGSAVGAWPRTRVYIIYIAISQDRASTPLAVAGAAGRSFYVINILRPDFDS